MDNYKRILTATIIGTQIIFIPNAFSASLSIEGEPFFSKDTGGTFRAVVRRDGSKKEEKKPEFRYRWEISGKKTYYIRLTGADTATVTVTLDPKYNLSSAISASLSCTVNYKGNRLGPKSIPIIISNLPPKELPKK